tara:strand:- start:76 stop:276 length:201 start_codon:yes stop_codon:yes gene_type:complete
MKYIPGNQFTNNTSKFGKYFKRSICYTLKQIKKQDDNLKYIFACEKGDKEIVFKNVKEADEFLGNF